MNTSILKTNSTKIIGNIGQGILLGTTYLLKDLYTQDIFNNINKMNILLENIIESTEIHTSPIFEINDTQIIKVCSTPKIKINDAQIHNFCFVPKIKINDTQIYNLRLTQKYSTPKFTINDTQTYFTTYIPNQKIYTTPIYTLHDVHIISKKKFKKYHPRKNTTKYDLVKEPLSLFYSVHIKDSSNHI